MIIYNYSATTGEYLNSSQAAQSPLDPGHYLIPAYATTIAPPSPLPAHSVAVFSHGVWSIWQDLRGTVYWDINYVEHVQTVLGPLPPDVTTTPPPDHRGTIYWTSDGLSHILSRLGPIPTNTFLHPPPPRFTTDAVYPAGTVMSIGNTTDLTISSSLLDNRVVGIISSEIPYSVNNPITHTYVAFVVVYGMTPCRVTGPIRQGDLLVSNGDGTAISSRYPLPGQLVGKAMQSWGTGTGTINIIASHF